MPHPDWVFDAALGADGKSVVFSAVRLDRWEHGNGDLWRVDIATGVTTTILSGTFDSNPADVADNPFFAPDGQLYFFYANVPNPDGFINRPPLQLVRSAPDGVTGRTVLSTEDFQLLNEALWAPDASFVIAAIALAQEIYQGGEAKIVYLDGRPSTVLTSFAQNMKWGP